MLQDSCPILQLGKLRYSGVADSALHQARDAALWVCRALGSVFQWQRTGSHWKGRICGGLLPCQRIHTFSQPSCAVRAAQEPSPAQRRDPEGPSVSQPCSSPLPPPPSAPPGHISQEWWLLPLQLPPGQSVGNTWALSTGQLWEGLPAIPISGAAPHLGQRGASPIPAVLGPGLGALSLPTLTVAGGCSEFWDPSPAWWPVLL